MPELKIHIASRLTDKPFGGGNQFLCALREYLRTQRCYVEHPEKADVLIFNSYPFGDAEHLYTLVNDLKRKKPEIAVIHRVDGPISVVRGSARDIPADSSIALFNTLIADATVFQSDWSRSICMRYGLQAEHPSTVITNAPDPTYFFPSADGNDGRNARQKRKIVATSWSSNWRKGFDIYRHLDEHLDFSRYEMTFVGNSPVRFKNICHVPALPSRELGALLRQHDFYITASIDDPCSNSLIEALHTGLPCVARRSGGHPELIGRGGILFDGHRDVLAAIDHCAANLHEYRRNISMPTIDDIGRQYLNFIEKACLTEKRRPPATNNNPLRQLRLSVFLQRRKSLLTKTIAKNTPLREDRFYKLPDGFRAQSDAGRPTDEWNEDIARTWVANVVNRLPLFMDSMRHPSNPSLYKYSHSGDLQPNPSLAASVFSAKIHHMLGLSDQGTASALASHILSFQQSDGSLSDPWVRKKNLWRRILIARRSGSTKNLFNQETGRAETRQAFAALRCLASRAQQPFLPIPRTPDEMRAYLDKLDWSQPWAAASHISHLAFFLHYNALWFGQNDVTYTADVLLEEVNRRYRNDDGGWYARGADISVTEKVNGAMKMITALNAAERPGPSAPEKLIDLSLSSLASGHACNHFNVVYVLNQCRGLTDYRSREIRDYCLGQLKQYRSHYWPYHGGFSFFPSGANDYYYGARMTTGMAEPDLHGTVLMLWGIVLLTDLLDWPDDFGLKKPWN